jgi:DNA repair exonuclease SbcCD ATPase subunit
MLQKIKDVLKTKEDIDLMNKNIEENNRVISELKVELETLRRELTESNKSQAEFLKNFRENLAVIKNLREDFGKELVEFKLLKGQLQRKILDKFEEELQKDLQINRESLKKDAEDYNELRKKAAEILSRLNMTGEEINKFIEISQSIKKEDFELAKFARHLLEMDREKLELMRKIDTLERLVSKIRRRELVR